ncbi:MAG: ABC transporter substrate-binding protein [Clostridia bacterium]|nr:ABC transporter substrate-binding protein [Clostridia bacterium]
MRDIFRKLLCLMFVILTLSTILASCGSAEEEEDSEKEKIEYSSDYDWKRLADKNITLYVYNWGEYISVDDGEEGAYDVNREFEKLTGIKVEYQTFASNETLYAKLKNGGASYDVIVPSDYMISRMINEGMLEKIDFSNVPNHEKYTKDDLKNPGYDPENEYSVPYFWGIVGLIYNKNLVDEEFIEQAENNDVSWSVLWDKKYAKSILMFANSRDAFMIAEFKKGFSVNTTDPEQLEEAALQLTTQKKLVQAYVMDEIFDKMGGGEAALAPYYAGDAITMIADTSDEDGESFLGFTVPKEGTNRFADAMCIPKGAANKEAAEMYINFLCEPAVALKNTEYVGYITPNTGAYELLDDETKEDPIYSPSEEILAKTEIYKALPADANAQMDGLWTTIMSTTGTSPWMTPVLLVAAGAVIVFVNVSRHLRKKRQKENNK